MSNPKLYLPITITTPKNDYLNISNQNKVNYYYKPESIISNYHQFKKNQLNNNYNYINSSQGYNNSYSQNNQERRHNTSNSGNFLYSNFKQYKYLNSEFINLRNSIYQLNEKIKEKDNIIFSLERELDLISSKNNYEKSKSFSTRRNQYIYRSKNLNNIKENEKSKIKNNDNEMKYISSNVNNNTINHRNEKYLSIPNSSTQYIDKNFEINNTITPFYVPLNRINNNSTNKQIILDDKDYKIQPNFHSFRGNKNNISSNSRINESIQQGKIENTNEKSNQIYKKFYPITLSYNNNINEFYRNSYGNKNYESDIINNIFKQYMKKRDEINHSKYEIKTTILTGNEKGKNEKSLTIDELVHKKNKTKTLKTSLSHSKKHIIKENDKFNSNIKLTKTPLNLKSNLDYVKNIKKNFKDNDNLKDKENHKSKSKNKSNKEINHWIKNKNNNIQRSTKNEKKNNKAKTPNSRTLQEKKTNKKLIKPKTYKTLELMKNQMMNEHNLNKNINNKKVYSKEKTKINIDSFNNNGKVNTDIQKEEKKSLHKLNDEKNRSRNTKNIKNINSNITGNIPSKFDSFENNKKEKQNSNKGEKVINLKSRLLDKMIEINVNKDNYKNEQINKNINTKNNIMTENPTINIKKENKIYCSKEKENNLQNNKLIKEIQEENKNFNKEKLELKEKSKELKINNNKNSNQKHKKLDNLDPHENIEKNPEIKIEENNSEELSIEFDIESKSYLSNSINNPVFSDDENLETPKNLKEIIIHQEKRNEQNKYNIESKKEDYYLKNNSNNKIENNNDSFNSLSNSNLILTFNKQKEFYKPNEKRPSSITLIDRKNSEFMSEKTLNEIQLTVNDLESPIHDKYDYSKKQKDLFFNKVSLNILPKRNSNYSNNKNNYRDFLSYTITENEQYLNEKLQKQGKNRNNINNIHKYSTDINRIQSSIDEKIFSKSYDDYKYPLDDNNDKTHKKCFINEKKLSFLGHFKYNIKYNCNEKLQFTSSSSNLTKFFFNNYLFSIFDENRIIVFNTITKTFLINEFIDESYSKFKLNYFSKGSLLLNGNDSLYIVTGNNFDMLYQYEPYKNIMRLLGKFKNNHINGGLLINSNIIYCLTGNFNNKVEKFNIKEKQFIENKENMKVERSEASYIIINKKYIFSFFGFNVIQNKYINSIEFSELNSNMNWKFIDILNNFNNSILELKGHCIINHNKNDHFLILGGYNVKKNPNEYIIKCEINLNEKEICILNLEKKFETILNKETYLFSYFFENDNLSNEKYIFDRKNNIHYFNTSQIKRDIFYLE